MGMRGFCIADPQSLSENARMKSILTLVYGLVITLVTLFGGTVYAVNAKNAAQTESLSWPRDFKNADGAITTIPTKPQRILSTTVSITGILLSIDAPVVASATATNGKFFAQWDKVAQERKIEKLWSAGNIDLEMAYVVAPDLIVVSMSGADSAYAQVEQLKQIAPTIILDYGKQTWQDLATELGKATGLEDKVAARITGFDHYLAECRAKIAIPEGKVNIISYAGPGTINPISTSISPHALLLSQLGFTIESADPAWHNNANKTGDFVWAQYENITQLTAPTTFLLSAGERRAAEFLKDPVLANLASVKTGQVYGLGVNSFRIDYYSAKEIADSIVKRFGIKPKAK